MLSAPAALAGPWSCFPVLFRYRLLISASVLALALALYLS